MENLKQILIAHGKKYPQMAPTDAVKLLYQNEFGGGHMIRDPQACLNYLRREYDATEKDASAIQIEDIGNGIIRVHLAALPEKEVDALGQAFLASAKDHTGSISRFRKNIQLLEQLTAEGIFSFSREELNRYLTEYEKAGYPAVSHSETYRRAYRPAYRIVKKEYWNTR